jgi:hypothetical protein
MPPRKRIRAQAKKVPVDMDAADSLIEDIATPDTWDQ